MTAIPAHIQGWSLDRVLGSGGFGAVELWIHKNGQKLAIKKCKRDVAQLTDIQQKRWINEVQIMKFLKHPNIIKGVDLPFKHPDDKIDLPLLCMEFCRKGDLRKVLNNVENCCGVSEKEAVTVMMEISSAVEYLHSMNITHRDLKPENIVLQDEHGIISYKLIDLGYAKELGEASTSGSLVGTLNYVAPELLWKETYSCSVDYWSLGILFYELVTGTRPFLPTMQHTMSWMQYIRNKRYDDIRAFISADKIIFGQDIANPTHLSGCLQDKLVKWFRIVLQWNPRKRGKQFDDNGTSKLVVFKLLHSILLKQVVYVFCASTYKLNAYEVASTTKIAEFQCMIEMKTNIPVNQQTLTDYFGNILTENQIPLLSQIQHIVLFIFKNESPLAENIPTAEIPQEVQKMLELSGSETDFETLQNYYRVTLFFIKQEVYLFQLYIFAVTIEVDLLIARVNKLDEDMTNILKTVDTLFNRLFTFRAKLQDGSVNTDRIATLTINFEKVANLVRATKQIKLKFNVLADETSKLKDTVQSTDYSKDVSALYNEATKIYELHKEEHSHRGKRSTEMVKVFFEFLKVQEAQCRTKNIPELIKQILTLQTKLSTLQTIFKSVTTMTAIYREELQDIIPHSDNDTPDNFNRESLNTSKVIHETTNVWLNNDYTEVAKQFNSNQFSNTSISKQKDIIDVDSNVIYDNLVLRYTLDNLLIEMQKKLMELLSLET